MVKKTHKVLDAVNFDEVMAGSFTECHDFTLDNGWGYKVVSLTDVEIATHNSNVDAETYLKGFKFQQGISNGEIWEQHELIKLMNGFLNQHK